jgi:hypothetical protein
MLLAALAAYKTSEGPLGNLTLSLCAINIPFVFDKIYFIFLQVHSTYQKGNSNEMHDGKWGVVDPSMYGMWVMVQDGGVGGDA